MSDSAASPSPSGARTSRRSWGTAVFVVGIVVLAFNLRAAITSLPPLFVELSARLHLSAAAVSVLASTPVLCFAVFSPVAAPLSRRFGEERVLLAALVALAVGLAARGLAPGALLYPGTVVATGSIALMNVLLPSLVKRRHPGRAGLLIGVYLLALSAGAILGSLTAVPVFHASGGSVPLAVGMWALPAVAAAVAWLPQWRFRTVPPASASSAGRGSWLRARRPGNEAGSRRPAGLSRQPLAWQVMGFMGLQSLIYYTTLSWLPTMFRDRGASAVHAGDLLALMNFGNAVTALLIPVLAHRTRDQRALIAGTAAITAIGLAGAFFAPLAGAAVWTLLLGLGQGASLGLAIYFTMARAADPATSASLSAFAQGAGYLLATLGPLAIGFLHTSTGAWTAPSAVLLLITVVMLVSGWQAARDRTLRAGPGAADAGLRDGAAG